MAKISTYPIISTPTLNDLLIGTDVENVNETKNFSIGDIANLIVIGNYIPYVGALEDVFLGAFNISANSFINTNGTVSDFLKADGSLDSTVYQIAGNYITSLTGEATGSGPGVTTVTLSNGAVIGKVLTGLTITGGSVSSTDSILQAFGKLQNQVNSLVGGVIYKGTWNASTNNPLIQSGVGTKGWYYVVNVAGSTNIDGISDWNVGDWIIFDGTAWQQVDNTDTVVSVNGQVGVVVLTTTNISEGTNLYFTDSRARSAISLTTTGNSGASTYSNLTGAFNIPNYTLSGLGGVPSTRQLSINGTSYDLSADRSWSVGTVTSVGTSAPLTGGTITGSGTIGITQAGVSSDGYLSSTDWNTFNNKQNALTNPVTGTGTVYYLPMWSGVSALTDSILSYASNTVTFNYNSVSGGTVNYTNTSGTTYTYTIQMNNTGSPRQTYHSYTDGNILQQINSNVVSKNLQSGQLVLPYYTTTSSFTGTNVGYLGFDSVGNILTVPVPSLSGYVPTTRTLTINGTNFDLSADRTWSVGTVTSVGLSMPSAFTVTSSPVTGSGTIAVTGAGVASQYVRGDGTLATFPNVGGGGGGTVYYLNGNTSQGSIGGTTMYQLSTAAQSGASANFTRSTTGVIASFITDVGQPNHLSIPAGIWVFECYLSETGGGSNHATIQAIVEKWNGTTITVIATGSAEEITNGSTKDLYQFAVSIPTGVTLLATDRIVIQVQIANANGKTVTLYTENSNISSVTTTFANGIASLNGLTSTSQYFATGTSGTDFAISSATDTHTFNLPTASATNRGALSSADWTTFNGKQDALPSQTGNNGKYLTTNGSLLSWASVDALPSQTGNSGKYLTTNGSAASWATVDALPSQTGNNGKYLTTDGTSASWVTVSTSNIYNSNGTLTSNRTLTSGGFNLTFTGSNTASSAIARGILMNHTLVASANSDVLVGLEINPTFTIGAFTGVSNIGLRVIGADIVINTLNIGLGSGSVATNTRVGVTALNANTTGSTNTAVGYESLLTVSNGVQNTAIGYRSGRLTTANQGTFVGEQAGVNVLGGGGNVLIGYTSGQNITTGSFNAIIGTNTRLGTTSANNAIIGSSSGFGITGNNNVFIGNDSGRYYSASNTAATAYTNSIMIGYQTKQLADNQTNQIVIGYAETGLGSNTTIIGNASTVTSAIRGRLLLGTTTDSGSYQLDVNGDARAGVMTVTRINTDGLANANNFSGAFKVIELSGTTAYGGLAFIYDGAAWRWREGTTTGFINLGGSSSVSISGIPYNSTGNYNVTIGKSAGGTGASQYNVALGWQSLYNNTSGGGNIGIGPASLYNVTTGVDNIGIGYYAGTSTASNVNANHNQTIFIGLNTGWSSGGTALTNTTIIGHQVRTDLSNVFMLGKSTQTIMIGQGTSVGSGAILQIDSTTKGFLPPRMTLTQRLAISSPATGLVVYQTDTTEGLYQYTSTGWQPLASGGGVAGASGLFNYYNFT